MGLGVGRGVAARAGVQASNAMVARAHPTLTLALTPTPTPALTLTLRQASNAMVASFVDDVRAGLVRVRVRDC